MTVVPLTSMPAAGAIGGTEIFYIQQTGADAQATLNQVRTYFKAITSVVVQSFTTNGTYTPTAGMVYCLAEVWGGGGGGGGTVSMGATSSGSATGGGGGGYARARLTAAQIGASKAVTIGSLGTGGAAGNNNGTAGGSCSLGSLCVATGGVGGNGNPGTGGFISGVSGGIGTTGDDLFAGGDGDGTVNTGLGTVLYTGGLSGAGAMGGGSARSVGQSFGAAGNFPGGGGGGAQSANTSIAQAGGNGALGYVRITEFCTS